MPVLLRIGLIVSVIVYSPNSTLAQVPERAGLVTLPDRVELYYQESGKGSALVFIPGFTFSADVFAGQLDYFSKQYRTVTYDPRGQGRSGISISGNNYSQHGRDLAYLLTDLSIKKPVLIGWSNGCRTIWEHIRSFGMDEITAFICIDGAPVLGLDCDGDWYQCKVRRNRRLVAQMENGDRFRWATEFSHWLLDRQANREEIHWLAGQQLSTPRVVALALANSMLYDDYRRDLIKVSQQIPVFYFYQHKRSKKSLGWLNKHAPRVETAVINNHIAFWESPTVFNEMLARYLNSLEGNEENLK